LQCVAPLKSNTHASRLFVVLLSLFVSLLEASSVAQQGGSLKVGDEADTQRLDILLEENELLSNHQHDLSLEVDRLRKERNDTKEQMTEHHQRVLKAKKTIESYEELLAKERAARQNCEAECDQLVATLEALKGETIAANHKLHLQGKENEDLLQAKASYEEISAALRHEREKLNGASLVLTQRDTETADLRERLAKTEHVLAKAEQHAAQTRGDQKTQEERLAKHQNAEFDAIKRLHECNALLDENKFEHSQTANRENRLKLDNERLIAKLKKNAQEASQKYRYDRAPSFFTTLKALRGI